MRLTPLAIILTALPALACTREAGDAAHDSTTAIVRDSVVSLAQCYRSPQSIMGRTTPLTGSTAVAPGWLRFAPAPDATGGPAAASPTDSGIASLVDADGASFQARWNRTADSVEVRGLNDFMEITLRLAVSDSALAGSGVVTSDADVQRDAQGRLEPLRREWTVTARAAACDGIPAAR